MNRPGHAMRILDANINRAAEGLRVLEDLARFHAGDMKISARVRRLRHGVRDMFRDKGHDLLAARDAAHDVGVKISADSQSDGRKHIKDTVFSNSKRVQEAMRSMEEVLKTMGDYTSGKAVEALRFNVYDLEPLLLSLYHCRFPQGLYGILGEKFSRGRSNIEVARQMVDAGMDILQYREKLKEKSKKQMLAECQEIRKITMDAGIPFIVNDHVDIAVMVDADGVHQGQDDLPIDKVRTMAPRLMIGCSTHSPLQAQKAIEDGADYIGVGPIYPTQTKEDVCNAVGLEYLDHVVATHDVPLVAIGGIKRHNLEPVLSAGARTVCLVTEIVGAEDIEQRVREIRLMLDKYLQTNREK